MATALASTFESSLSEYDVELTRTDADGFDEALAECVEAPAVGARLPWEDVSLEASSVDVNCDPSPSEVASARTGVTAVGMGVAEYGSVVVRPSPNGEEPASLFPERHIAVLAESDLVPDMPDAIARLADEFAESPGDAIVATGPSATADMGALVYGAHGPKQVEVLLLEDR